MSRLCLLFAFFAAISCNLGGHDSRRPTSEVATEKASLPSDEDSLKAAAEQLISAIETSDAKRVLGMISRKGIEFGADNWVSYEAIEKDFQDRGIVYCEFFDTACLRDHLRKRRFTPARDIEGIRPWPASCKEILATVSGLEISTKREPTKSGQEWGQVVVRWVSPSPRSLGGSFLNFAFVREAGDWKLITDAQHY